ncbi:DUF4870 domain-containing protein [Demequina salsinemoris]|uniref:DUF4870 domain-containing protein n=1 Tax=Demequina salsinemoris TaxID=577470 RepID=UPI000786627E|nr:DUF4870 domain-containing protein [Demequina salsinemoris]
MNDTDRTEGAETTPDAAPQDAAGTQAEGVSQPPALEAGPTASSSSEAPSADSTIPPYAGQQQTGQQTGQQYGQQPPAQQPYTPQRMLESEARNWSMLIHIIAGGAALLSAGTVSWLVPLVLWLIFKDRSALIDHHGKQQLNLQLTVLISGVAAVVLGLLMLVVGLAITLPLWGIYVLYSIVISFVAGVKANNGEYYKIPLMIPFVR